MRKYATLFTDILRCQLARWRRRPIGYLIFICYLLEKSPIISGSYAGRDLQRMASCVFPLPCTQCTTISKMNSSVLKVQGGEDSYDPLSLQVVFRKSDLYLVAVLWKMTCNLGDPISLRHPVHVASTLKGPRIHKIIGLFCKRDL